MQKIIGLIIKDLLELKSYKKNLILCIVIYSFVIFTDTENETILIWASMIMFLFSLYAISTFNYDEKCKTDRYLLTLPITKKDYLLSKYIFCFLSIIAGAIIGSLLVTIVTYIRSQTFIDIKSLLTSLLFSTYALSLMQCIQIPCICKYGAEKGRMQIYIIMMISICLLSIIFTFVPKINLNILSKLMIFLPIIILLLIVINYYVSLKISYKIYNKREI